MTGFILISPDMAKNFKGGKKYHRAWPEPWPVQLDKILRGFESIWSDEFIARYRAGRTTKFS